MTLTELLIAMVAAVVLGAAAMIFIVVSLNQENAVSSRAVATRNAQAALGQLSRDLRQAMPASLGGSAVTVTSSATTPPTTTISFSIPTPGSYTTAQTLTWTCQGSSSSPGYCKRQLGSGGNAIEIVGYEGVTFMNASGGNLTPTITDPAYLGISMTLAVTSALDNKQLNGSPTNLRSSSPITIQTGIDLRNEI